MAAEAAKTFFRPITTDDCKIAGSIIEAVNDADTFHC